MKRAFVSLIFFSILTICFSAFSVYGQSRAARLNDWQRQGLRGQVKSMTLSKISYENLQPIGIKQINSLIFDQEGNRIATPIDPTPNDNIAVASGDQFIYDSDGRITEIMHTDVTGQLYRRVLISYDNNGRRNQISYFHPDGQLERNNHYYYDDRGNIIEELSFDSSQIDPSYRDGIYYHLRSTYQYNDQNLRSVLQIYRGETLATIIKHEYNQTGQITKTTEFDSKEQPKSQRIFTFDNNANLLTETQLYNSDLTSNNSQFQSGRKLIYKYDNKGNWIEQYEYEITRAHDKMVENLIIGLKREIEYF